MQCEIYVQGKLHKTVEVPYTSDAINMATNDILNGAVESFDPELPHTIEIKNVTPAPAPEVPAEG